ncbi:hypothetical protein D5R81_03740 [Parashewanella spongiae]|uniref:Uncharacterized protein n=1 Tax=Parashewanella spongiae TaxID=342950 RepID=A0A3A6UIA4_9GAMM|nr:hypothetical protein D5R81_03740 [Parashewanella spongiae]
MNVCKLNAALYAAGYIQVMNGSTKNDNWLTTFVTTFFSLALAYFSLSFVGYEEPVLNTMPYYIFLLVQSILVAGFYFILIKVFRWLYS